MVNVLRNTGEKDYARIRALSEELLRVEKELEKRDTLLSAQKPADPVSLGKDVFSLEAGRLFLAERLKKAQENQDSLLKLLVETEMEAGEGFSSLESELGADSDPRRKTLGAPRPENPDQERLKARLVGSLDSLKKEIAGLKAALAENAERMRRELKGREK